jgi:hypothetical protein
MRTLRILLLVAPVVLAACSGKSAAPDTSPPPATTADASTDAPAKPPPPPPPGTSTDAGVNVPTSCTSLALDPRSVTLEDVAATAPGPKGGVVHDGTYVLTSAVRYVGPGGSAGPTSTVYRMTLRVTGNVVERVDMDGATTATLTTSGAILTAKDTCPDDTTEEVGFTADDASVVAFIPTKAPTGGPATLVETFTKQ